MIKSYKNNMEFSFKDIAKLSFSSLIVALEKIVETLNLEKKDSISVSDIKKLIVVFKEDLKSLG